MLFSMLVVPSLENFGQAIGFAHMPFSMLVMPSLENFDQVLGFTYDFAPVPNVIPTVPLLHNNCSQSTLARLQPLARSNCTLNLWQL